MSVCWSVCCVGFGFIISLANIKNSEMVLAIFSLCKLPNTACWCSLSNESITLSPIQRLKGINSLLFFSHYDCMVWMLILFIIESRIVSSIILFLFCFMTHLSVGDRTEKIERITQFTDFLTHCMNTGGVCTLTYGCKPHTIELVFFFNHRDSLWRSLSLWVISPLWTSGWKERLKPNKMNKRK